VSRDEEARWFGSSMVDLDNTANCPVGHRCESCGVESGDLAVETATSGRLGVLCLTLCRRCASFDDQIPVSVGTAVRLVMQHCQHLGITADEMAAELER
jgi:hypothetical protein